MVPREMEAKTSHSLPLEASLIIDDRIAVSSESSPDSHLKSQRAYYILTRNKSPLLNISCL